MVGSTGPVPLYEVLIFHVESHKAQDSKQTHDKYKYFYKCTVFAENDGINYKISYEFVNCVSS